MFVCLYSAWNNNKIEKCHRHKFVSKFDVGEEENEFTNALNQKVQIIEKPIAENKI